MKQQLIALALSTALLAGSAAVQTCYEVGLMTGTGAGFAPDQVLTVGEVAAIAARMNEAITGDSI